MVLVIEPQHKYLLRSNIIIHRDKWKAKTQTLQDSPVGAGLLVLNLMYIVISSECFVGIVVPIHIYSLFKMKHQNYLHMACKLGSPDPSLRISGVEYINV